jgi:hypothetical protein
MKKLFSVLLVILLMIPCTTIGTAENVTTNEYLSGDFTYLINRDGNAVITKYNGRNETVTIPDALDGHDVVEIDNYVFSCCTSLISITLPSRLQSIGIMAFTGCSSLETISLPDNVEFIGDGAFYGCSSLTSICIPANIVSIGRGAFGFCTSLTSINLPDSLEFISETAFACCPSLTLIVLRDSYASEYAKKMKLSYEYSSSID